MATICAPHHQAAHVTPPRKSGRHKRSARKSPPPLLDGSLVLRVGRSPSPSRPASSVTILHFNDVYEIEPRAREPVGGAARFASLVKSFAGEEPLLLNGDPYPTGRPGSWGTAPPEVLARNME